MPHPRFFKTPPTHNIPHTGGLWPALLFTAIQVIPPAILLLQSSPAVSHEWEKSITDPMHMMFRTGN